MEPQFHRSAGPGAIQDFLGSLCRFRVRCQRPVVLPLLPHASRTILLVWRGGDWLQDPNIRSKPAHVFGYPNHACHRPTRQLPFVVPVQVTKKTADPVARCVIDEETGDGDVHRLCHGDRNLKRLSSESDGPAICGTPVECCEVRVHGPLIAAWEFAISRGDRSQRKIIRHGTRLIAPDELSAPATRVKGEIVVRLQTLNPKPLKSW